MRATARDTRCLAGVPEHRGQYSRHDHRPRPRHFPLRRLPDARRLRQTGRSHSGAATQRALRVPAPFVNAASLALQAGADLKAVQDQLGHSSIIVAAADADVSVLPDVAHQPVRMCSRTSECSGRCCGPVFIRLCATPLTHCRVHQGS